MKNTYILFINILLLSVPLISYSTDFVYDAPVNLSISDDNGCNTSTYTFTQKTNNDGNATHTTSNICTITFPTGTDATTFTSGTWYNSTPIVGATTTATTITFTVPEAVPKKKEFIIVLNGITNGDNLSNTCSISCTNSSGGVNTATYNLTTTACTGPGSNSASTVTLTPGTQQCGTNTSSGDFPDDASAPSNPCDGYYNDGEYWFSYTGNGSALQLDVSGLSDTYSGIYVLDDIPSNSPNCITSHSSSSTADYSVTTPALTNGQTYYIVIANWSSPYSTNFCLTSTVASACGTTISSLPYTEGFEAGLGDWTQSATDDTDWTNQTGSTTSSSTGPSSAQEGSNYLYTEATGYSDNIAILTGPCLDFTSCATPQIKFWYHMYGSTMGSLDLEVEATPGSGTWVSLWSLSGDQGDSWQQANVDLTAYGSTTIKLRFKGVTGSDFYSDMAIDNISVSCATDMTFSSCTTTQTNISDVTAGSSNEEVIGIEIVTIGSINAFDASSFTFNTTGTTAATTDITNATLWSTGTSNTFATTTQLGAVVATPNGSFTITGGTNMPYTLSEGTNYFWITYDIPGNATIDNFIDAECTSITINGIAETPDVTAPADDRKIIDCLLGSGIEYVTLPFTDASASTCGAVDDITSVDVANICGSTSYYTGEDYVYIFTPSATGSITIDLTSAGTYTGMILYEGCPTDAGTCIDNQQSSSGDESTCVSVTSGIKYYLIIDSYASPDCNDYGISISAPNVGSQGFTCATAYNIESLPFTSNGHHTACSGDDYTSASTGSCTSSYLSGEDYVFEYAASTSECISITLSNTNSSASFSVYEDCPGTGSATCLGTFHQASSPFAGTVTLASAGTYYIIVDTDNTGALNTPFDIDIISYGSGQINDLPCNATPLTLGSILTGDNACSSGASEPTTPACWITPGTINTVWYSIVAPASGELKIRTELLTLSNTQIALYSGDCSSLVEVGCNDDQPICGGTTYLMSELTASGLTSGDTYYVCVDGYSDLTGTFTISAIDGSTLFPPSFGQDCGVSQAIPVCSQQFTVGNPGYQAVGNNCDFTSTGNCTGGERGSVWYSIPIQSNGNLEFSIEPNDYDGTDWSETDYDYIVWKFTGTGSVTCAEIAAGTAVPISCNFDADGITGLYDTGDAPAAYGTTYDSGFEPEIPVLTGEVYVLVVSNYDDSQSGFSVDFGASSPITYPGTPTTLTWTGGAGNSDWFTPMNWGNCDAYPNETIDATILPASMYQPVIDRVDPNNGNNARCKSFTVNPGSTVSISSGFTFEVYGDFDNSGTMNANANSTTSITGTAIQTMNGNMTGFSKFGNFNIDKTGGDITLNNDLEAVSDFTTSNATSIINTNGFHVIVGGDFTLNTSITYTGVSTTGILEFNGTSAQNYTTGTGATLQLNDVIMNNTSTGLVLNDDLSLGASGELTLTSGLITTGSNKVIINNTSSTATPTGSTDSYINGTLRGYVASNTDTYNYPVGISDRYTLAQIINNNITGTNYFDVKFLDSFTNTGSLNPSIAEDFGVPYAEIAPEGIWEINPDIQPTVGSYSLELFFDDGEGYDGGGIPIGNGFAYLEDNEFGIVKRSGASTSAADWTAQEGILNPTDGAGRLLHDNYAKRKGLSTFSRFAIARTAIILPIELIAFETKCDEENKVINWSTISEINNDFFTLERKAENKFVPIATIDGADNSNSLLNYTYTDKNSEYGVNYYRLKQTDIDGKYSYSKIITSNCTTTNILSVNQYIENEFLNVIVEASNDDNFTFEFFDYSGKSLIKETRYISNGYNSFKINTKHYAKGIYMLVVKNKHDVYSDKVIIK